MNQVSLFDMHSTLENQGYKRYLPHIEDLDEEKDNICFGCADKNPDGLKMHFYYHPEQDWIVSPVIIPQKFCGYPIYAHGGILTTLIDEIMSHVINFHENCYAVTSQLTMKFIKPVMIGRPLMVIGRFIRAEKSPKRTFFYVSGEVREGLDFSNLKPVLAQGEGKWVQLSSEVLQKMAQKMEKKPK